MEGGSRGRRSWGRGGKGEVRGGKAGEYRRIREKIMEGGVETN